MAKKKARTKTTKKAAPKKAAAKSKSGKADLKSKLAALKKKFLGSKKPAAKPASGKADSAAKASGAKKSAAEIVAEECPGMRIVNVKSISDKDLAGHATASGAGVDALRQHYYGASDSAGPSILDPSAADSEVVMVEPVASDAGARGPGPKAIIVSGGRIVGRQG